MTWNFDAAGFSALVADAVRAPSVHNSQPWRFRLTDSAIDLELDDRRVLPVADPTRRGARISCGAALFNLRLALAVRGTPGRLTELGGDPVLARLVPAEPRPGTPLERRLHAAIPRRHTNREPFADQPVPARVQAALVDAAVAEDGWLDLVLGPEAVEATAGLTGVADEILSRDPAYLAELRSWTRTDTGATDGVLSQLGGPAPHPAELLTRRDFGTGRPMHEYEREPLIGVLGAAGDAPADEIRTGMALQRVLLTATDLGVAASLFTQPIEVPAVREQLRLALRRLQPPQVVLRLGYAVGTGPTPRRPATEVIASG